jgi:hypothetical protein
MLDPLTTGLTNYPSIVLIADCGLYANNYIKIWCSLQKQTTVVVLCKKDTNKWCHLLFPRLGKEEACWGRSELAGGGSIPAGLGEDGELRSGSKF